MRLEMISKYKTSYGDIQVSIEWQFSFLLYITVLS